jgi:putative selenate reductase
MFRELEEHQRIFDLPAERFFLGDPARDLSVPFHRHRAGTPLGPAAGPHTQMAQNIVLSFLGGARIFELKTVQIDDQLKIPRPCIDMQTVGYNVEWSQELRIEQSLEEYVKASMLLEILLASGKLALVPGRSMERFVFDLSVGYDLKGIQTPRMRAFLDGMLDARSVVDRLRKQLTGEHARWRDLDFTTRIADTLTLSTFHGCPPDEIERMLEWLMRAVGLDCIVKLNPTLLGPKDARRILNEELGYPDRVPEEAFTKDTSWDQAVDFAARLLEVARSEGRSFGVKFSNTLIVENERAFFPSSEKVMYLSGPPLHVLAMHLVGRWRAQFGDAMPISFSAGVDRKNFPDAVRLGLVPVTVCSDLLRTGGYARMKPYFTELAARMEKLGARTIDDFILRGATRAGPADQDAVPTAQALSAAKVASTGRYVETLASDPRYASASNRKTPPKVGSRLDLFDCLTCDKCIPVCPNDAIFTYALDSAEIPIVKARPLPDGTFELEQQGALKTEKRHQIAIFADFCNECGNCDVFCPEDGGPYALKPRFFGSLEEWKRHAKLDGFFAERTAGGERIVGRIRGRESVLLVEGDQLAWRGEGFDLRCQREAPAATLRGTASGEVDLTWLLVLDRLRSAVLASGSASFVGP